jgi:signal transduction histidine kinase
MRAIILAITIQVTIPMAFNRDMGMMNEIYISFVDSGISIPEQIMNFFTRFYRMDKSHSRRQEAVLALV